MQFGKPISNNSSSRRSPRSRCVRCGAVYITVLFTALIVAIITLTGLQLVTMRSKTTRAALDASLARHATRTGLEIALARIATDPNWKTNLTSGVRTNLEGIDVDDAGIKHAFSYALTSPTGTFENIGGGTLTLTAYGQVGESSAAAQIDLRLTKEPSPKLDHSLFARGWLYSQFAQSSISTDGKILTGAGATQTSVIQAARVTTDQNAFTTTFDWKAEYQKLGTQITRWTFPSYNQSGRQVHYINRELYGPNSNPRTNKTDPNGIYWVDCEGNDFQVQDMRFLGTLVLINCQNLWIFGPVVMESVSPEYPAILCDGHIVLASSTDALRETSGNIHYNFNPASTPYRGQSDNDLSDSYPSIIRGLVYAGGHLYTFNHDYSSGLYRPVTRIEGIVGIEGDGYFYSPISITFDPRINANPPAGFCDSSTTAAIPRTFRYVDSDSSP